MVVGGGGGGKKVKLGVAKGGNSPLRWEWGGGGGGKEEKMVSDK